MAVRNKTYKSSIKDAWENHPFIAVIMIFIAGFSTAYIFFNFYYNDKIEDIEKDSKDKLDQQIKNCENEIKLKVLEIQAQERDRYYQRIEENSANAVIFERAIELIDKKNRDEK